MFCIKCGHEISDDAVFCPACGTMFNKSAATPPLPAEVRMIYTVTLNPALDHSVHLSGLKEGAVNRTVSEHISFGGKGINVSAVLTELGVNSTALGFIAGFTGDALERELKKARINTDFVRLKSGFTRINVKIHAGTDTEINASGPDIDNEALEALFRKTDGIKDGDTVVIAGSIPKSLPGDIYEQLLTRLSDRKIMTAVDAEGGLLTSILKFRPFVIKPNIYELSAIFGCTVRGTSEAEKYARELRREGARNVLVSMGADGALLIDENDVSHYRTAFSGKAVNPVGAGDSMLAGFLAGVPQGYDYALLLGTAAGGAAAFSEGHAKKEQINDLLSKAL